MLIAAVREKKYTEDHEWIEFSEGGKICMFCLTTPTLTCI